MSKEFNMLAKEYQSKKATVLRKDLNLYQTTMSRASSGFLQQVESKSKKEKQCNIVLIAVIPEPEEER